jgi:hypothetical protein
MRPTEPLVQLDHGINLPCVVDWDRESRPEILVGAEDGYIMYLRNCGDGPARAPR